MESKTIGHLTLHPTNRKPLLKSQQSSSALPIVGHQTHPTTSSSGNEDASLTFIGNATTLLEWRGVRLLTDPNFLHAGDHVHLGPGVTATRLKNPHVDLHQLPPLDAILLSHYHEDHFDKLVEDSLNRDFDIISTPHAKRELEGKPEAFSAVHALEPFESLVLGIPSDGNTEKSVIKVTATPGKHVPPGFLEKANDLLGAVPPTNGWMLELGHTAAAGDGNDGEVQTGYRIYISGDTLLVDDLKEIPARLKNEKIDLMLVHLGGTTIPGPKMPLLMVTMDAKQGLQLMRLVDPDVTIPIHFDDYDVFVSSLDEFKGEVKGSEFEKKVVYLDRGEQYRFKVRGE